MDHCHVIVKADTTWKEDWIFKKSGIDIYWFIFTTDTLCLVECTCPLWSSRTKFSRCWVYCLLYVGSVVHWICPSTHVLPWTKKEPSPRFAVRRTLFDLVITSDQGKARSSATQSATFALRWSCVIEHDIRWWNSVLLTANLGNGSFFFLRGVLVWVLLYGCFFFNFFF